MIVKQNPAFDFEIIALIEQHNPVGWKKMYDKYALSMYVAVLWVVDDTIFAENILTQLFYQLKVDKTLLNSKKTLSASLLHYTYVTTYKMLRADNKAHQNERSYNDLFTSLDDLVYEPYAFMNVPERQISADEKGILKLCSDLNLMHSSPFQKIKASSMAVTMSIN